MVQSAQFPNANAGQQIGDAGQVGILPGGCVRPEAIEHDVVLGRTELSRRPEYTFFFTNTTDKPLFVTLAVLEANNPCTKSDDDWDTIAAERKVKPGQTIEIKVDGYSEGPANGYSAGSAYRFHVVDARKQSVRIGGESCIRGELPAEEHC